MPDISRQIAILIMAFLLVSCDKIDSFGSIPDASISHRFDPRCSCSSKAVFVKNNSSKNKASILIRNFIREPGKEIYGEREYSVEVGPLDDKWLGCDRVSGKDRPPGETTCTADNWYEVKGTTQILGAGAYQSRFAVYIPENSQNYFRRLNNTRASKPPAFSCKAECLDNSKYVQNGLCRKIDIPNTTYKSGLNHLSNSIAKKETSSLNQSQLQSWFGLGADNCGRSDTLFIKNRLRNVGSTCVFEANFRAFSESHTIKLSVPDILSAKRVPEQGNFVLDFDNDNQRPILEISKKLLNNQYGGPIYQIDKIENSILLKMPKGCLWAKI